MSCCYLGRQDDVVCIEMGRPIRISIFSHSERLRVTKHRGLNLDPPKVATYFLLQWPYIEYSRSIASYPLPSVLHARKIMSLLLPVYLPSFGTPSLIVLVCFNVLSAPSVHVSRAGGGVMSGEISPPPLYSLSCYLPVIFLSELVITVILQCGERCVHPAT